MNQKLSFLQTQFPALLRTLPAGKKGAWGLMNAQQMVEHLTDTLRIAAAQITYPPALPPELQEKTRMFFLSDKPFKENMRNAILPAVPPPPRTADMQEAVTEMEAAFEFFIRFFEEQPERRTLNPMAGEFTFDDWIHLLHKHALHHAKQFGLEV